DAIHVPNEEASPTLPPAAAVRSRGFLVRRARGVAALAVELYGPQVRPTVDGLRTIRRLYDVLEIGGFPRDRAGLAELAAGVFNIDETNYQNGHGRLLVELVDQAAIPGMLMTGTDVGQAHMASFAMHHLAGHLSLTVPEQQ